MRKHPILVLVTFTAFCAVFPFWTLMHRASSPQKTKLSNSPHVAVETLPAQASKPYQSTPKQQTEFVAHKPDLKAIEAKVLNATIERIREPLFDLFEHWHLDIETRNQLLGLIREKLAMRQAHLGSNATEGPPQTFNPTENKLIALLGGVDRYYAMDRLMTRIIVEHYLAGLPEDKASNDKLAKLLHPDVKAALGR